MCSFGWTYIVLGISANSNKTLFMLGCRKKVLSLMSEIGTLSQNDISVKETTISQI